MTIIAALVCGLAVGAAVFMLVAICQACVSMGLEGARRRQLRHATNDGGLYWEVCEYGSGTYAFGYDRTDRIVSCVRVDN
jgi:hypothetical protein